MAMTDVQAGLRWKPIALWGLKGLLAAVFVAAGGAKLYGVPMLVEEFEHIGLGQWFRYVTGTLEIAGGLAILVPLLSGIAAVLLGCVMVGATAMHLFVIGGSPVPAIVLLALCAAVAIVERARIIAGAAIFRQTA
jgi:putative oxidoreductase